jgi:para-aminobenzoate synthetase component 1
MKQLNWQDPLAFAAGFAGYDVMVLLYSGLQTNYSGRYSILGLHPKKIITSDKLDSFESQLSRNKECFENAWFGYLGYDLKNSLESLPQDADSILNFPSLWMAQFASVYVFDHSNKTLMLYGEDAIPYPINNAGLPPIHNLTSNMTKAEYLSKVEAVLEHIRAGDIYQANLTRKFYGSFESKPNAWHIFEDLCKISPAPYSAYIKWHDQHVLSSSPEQFLNIDTQGVVYSRPIKGSQKRSHDNVEDKVLKTSLASSEKDKAENLMIVDLMRNDLSRQCVSGSVEVSNLFEVDSFATIHHMASTISGTKHKNAMPMDIVTSCFPPGSMTGTPKIKAMEICTHLEQQARNVYSGALGWFGGDGSADLSVIIRTLLIRKNQFEFQVGGGIVADSDPEREWEETLTKALAIASAIQLDFQTLQSW